MDFKQWDKPIALWVPLRVDEKVTANLGRNDGDLDHSIMENR